MALSIEAIRKKVIDDLDDKIDVVDDLWFYLARWWCKYYNRPFRDELLLSYSIEELLYEFFAVYYSQNADKIDEARAETERDKAAADSDEEWIKRVCEEHGVKPLSVEAQESMLSGVNIDQMVTDRDEAASGWSDGKTEVPKDLKPQNIKMSWDEFK